MAYQISDACISCGSCAGECPVNAIAQGDGKYEIDADTVIMSLGTSPNPLISSTTKGLDVNRRGCIICEEDGATSKDAVYAGGDAVTGAATVILAMGAGKAAAQGIHEYFQNK